MRRRAFSFSVPPNYIPHGGLRGAGLCANMMRKHKQNPYTGGTHEKDSIPAAGSGAHPVPGRLRRSQRRPRRGGGEHPGLRQRGLYPHQPRYGRALRDQRPALQRPDRPRRGQPGDARPGGALGVRRGDLHLHLPHPRRNQVARRRALHRRGREVHHRGHYGPGKRRGERPQLRGRGGDYRHRRENGVLPALRSQRGLSGVYDHGRPAQAPAGGGGYAERRLLPGPRGHRPLPAGRLGRGPVHHPGEERGLLPGRSQDRPHHLQNRGGRQRPGHPAGVRGAGSGPAGPAKRPEFCGQGGLRLL